MQFYGLYFSHQYIFRPQADMLATSNIVLWTKCFGLGVSCVLLLLQRLTLRRDFLDREQFLWKMVLFRKGCLFTS